MVISFYPQILSEDFYFINRLCKIGIRIGLMIQ